jgi:hypothetical protein
MSQQINTITIPYESLGEKNPAKNYFETVLAEAVDEVFMLFGENTKQAIYSLLENNFGIKKMEISSKIEAFADAVVSTFGSSALLVELKIIEKLYGKIGEFKFKSGKRDLLFVDYLAGLRSHLQNGEDLNYC